MSFDAAEKRPGAPTVLHVESDPDSLCAIGAVDKSVHILGGSNQLTAPKVCTYQRFFEPTCTYARWALMHHVLSVTCQEFTRKNSYLVKYCS